MALTTLPTKVDGSIGRVKSALPGSDPAPDLDYFETVAEYERHKTALVDVCAEVGLTDGSTSGSLVERVIALEGAAGGFGYVWTEGSITLADANLIVDVGDVASLSLPVASAGRVYFIRMIGNSGPITLIPADGDKIDGGAVDENLVLPGSHARTDTGEDRYVWTVTAKTEDGNGWSTSQAPVRLTIGEAAPLATSDITEGFAVGSLWATVTEEDSLSDGLWVCLDNAEDSAIWRYMGTGNGTSDGWAGGSSASATVTPVIPQGGLVLRLSLAGGNTTVNLPAGVAGYVLIITVTNSAHSTVTLHPFAGDTVQYGTADYLLPNSRVYTPGPVATQPTLSYLLTYNGATWVLVAPAVPTQGAIPNGYAVPMLPDCDVCLLNTGGGPLDYPMPAVVVGVPHIMLLKKTSTDTNTLTFSPSGAELIEGANASFLVPDSASADRPSWTWYRDFSGDWWLL